MDELGHMPAEAQHLAQYRVNAALSRDLEARGYLDWSVTTMFYAALHLADAYAARTGVHPQNHQERNNHIQADPVLAGVWRFYQRLSIRSRDARYGCLTFLAAAVRQLHLQNYEPLEQQLRAWLGI